MKIKKPVIKRNLIKLFVYMCLIILSIVMIFPFLWTFFASVKTTAENITPSFVMLPEASFTAWQWESYTTAMEIMKFWQSLINTLIITIPKLFGDVIISALVAYGFARFEFKYKKILFLILLATLMIPFEITMIPLYIVYAKIGWIDTFYPLIIPSMGGASQFIFFLTMYFLTMPKELISAARVDGFSDLAIFRKIYLPIGIPALVVVGIWSFQGSWNDLLGPLIWLQSSDLFTLQLALASISTTTTYQVDQNVIMAATILVMVPVLLMFLSLQRYILDSTKTSGIKG